MKMNISQDASSMEHFSQNLSPPKFQNLENEGPSSDQFILWGSESLASFILWFCNTFVTKKHVTLDVLGVPLSYLMGNKHNKKTLSQTWIFLMFLFCRFLERISIAYLVQ